MTRAKGYSLWLMPTGDVYDALTETIARLSKLYGTPAFEPHLTLLGQVDGPEEQALSKTQQLSTLIPQFQMTLGSADYLHNYFMCLFLRIEQMEPLIKANLKARRVFNCHRDPKYFPHLSLMYGTVGPGVKQTIVPTVTHHCDTRFEARSIHLFSTDGEPQDWRRVREFSLI